MKNIIITILWFLLSNVAICQSNVSEFLKVGDQLLREGDLKGAINSFTNAIKLDSNNAVTFNKRGEAWYRSKEYNLALQDFERAINLNADYANAYYNRGLIKYLTGLGNDAIKDFDKCIDINTTHQYDAQIYKGLSLISQHKTEEGCLEIANSIYYNTNDSYYFLYGMLSENCKGTAGDFFVEGYEQTDKAKYDKAIELNSKYLAAYFERGKIRFNLNDVSGALEDFDKIIGQEGRLGIQQKNRDFTQIFGLEEAYLARGIETSLKTKFADSVSIKLDADLDKAAFDLSQAKSALSRAKNGKDSSIVKEAYAKVIRDLDRNKIERENITKFIGKSKKALEDITIAILIKPDFADAYFHLANCWLWNGPEHHGGNQAVFNYDKCIELNSKYKAEAYNNRGLAKINLEHYLEACSDFEKAKELGYESAKKSLEKHCKK